MFDCSNNSVYLLRPRIVDDADYVKTFKKRLPYLLPELQLYSSGSILVDGALLVPRAALIDGGT